MNKGMCLLLALILVLAACGGGGTTGDTTKPTVSLASSSTNVTVAGSITLTATANDNVGVSKVEFFDGSTKLSEDATAPYTASVALTAANNGSKSYTAKAFDATGNNETSPAVAVTVNIVADTKGPILLSSTAKSNTTVDLVFNEVVTGGTLASNFSIVSASVTALAVTAASTSPDGKTVTLTTASQKAGESYGVVTINVKDLAGNAFDFSGTTSNAMNFTGIGP
jgi:chitinase